MTSQNLKYEKYISCTTGDHLKYYTILVLFLLLAHVLTTRLISRPVVPNHVSIAKLLLPVKLILELTDSQQ